VNEEKEKNIDEFFRSLRVTLTNAFSYPKDHPYFLKSVENFKLKLQEALESSDPLKIGVTDLGLVVDGKNLNRAGFYDELARLLHQRKIKSIEIKSGATLEEIVRFFSVISMSPKDIFKGGGVNAILGRELLGNFIIEELDYSAFLQEGKEECSDIWNYILKDAVQSNDQAKINNFADNFGSLIKKSSQDDILESEEVPSNIDEFLVSLKQKNKEQFIKCSKDIFLWFLRNKKSFNEEKIAKLKRIFNSLNHDDLGTLFWEGLSQEDNFDALSLEIFSKISEQKNPSLISEGLLNKAAGSRQAAGNSRVARRVKDLLTVTQGNQMSAVYRHTLESLARAIFPSGVLSLDQGALRENYLYIILNILAVEEDKDSLLSAAEAIEKELGKPWEDNDLVFLKDLGGLLAERRKVNSVCADLEKKFSAFVENIILNQPLTAENEFFLEMVSFPTQEIDFYLDKIFTAEKANKHILSLFLKFFPGNLDIFYAKVKPRLPDIDFLFSLIEALGQISTPVTLGILDHIYDLSNELIKIEILKKMRKLKKVNVHFLLRRLDTDSPSLRKNLVSVLILNAQGSEEVLDMLLKIPSFCGKNNWLLIENMQIVFDLGMIEAARYIRDLSRRRFFWNRKLRDKAKQILKEWNAY
jgi:hypothetical protein